ncbi:Protein of unknown function, partial [Gryllus bimaculatus]
PQLLRALGPVFVAPRRRGRQRRGPGRRVLLPAAAAAAQDGFGERHGRPGLPRPGAVRPGHHLAVRRPHRRRQLLLHLLLQLLERRVRVRAAAAPRLRRRPHLLRAQRRARVRP